jgi:hypothetical protein
VKSLEQPDLLDLVVVATSEDVTMEDVEDLRPSKRKTIYSEVCYLEVAVFWKWANHNCSATVLFSYLFILGSSLYSLVVY